MYWAAGGKDADDPRIGVLIVDDEGTFKPFRLPSGSGRIQAIYAMNDTAVCVVTADNMSWTFKRSSRSFEPFTNSGPCPRPVRYTVGEAHRANCAEASVGTYEVTRMKSHDCWTVAADPYRLAWFLGGTMDDGSGLLEAFVPGATLAIARRPGHELVIPDGLVGLRGGDVTITRISWPRVCFRAGDTPGVADFRQGTLAYPAGQARC
jgi:hypothetical protein